MRAGKDFRMRYYEKRIDKAFEEAKLIKASEHGKIVFFSDCHRGCGTWNDSFLSNKILYQAALNYYWQHDFTYIEVGDGDELWENRNFKLIQEIHGDIFVLLDKFNRSGRLYMIWGNHDKAKSKKAFSAKGSRFSPRYYQSAVIQTPYESQNLYVLHGHQADIFNDRLWLLARWMVRYLWKPLELAGFKDPTSAARNYRKSKKVEKRLAEWAEKKGRNILAGHTHRPILPPEQAAGYFNTGSCVHPNGITCMELISGHLSLIRWNMCVKEDNSLYVCRHVLYGPKLLR